MPKNIRDLDAEARKHAQIERKAEMPLDFFARTGYRSEKSAFVTRQWFILSKCIFLNEEQLDLILKARRQQLLLKLLQDFLKHPSSERRKLRAKALHFVHHEMFETEAMIDATDENLTQNYAGIILDKLTSKNYGQPTIADDKESCNYSIHPFISTEIAEDIKLSVDTINGIFKHAFIHLTGADTDENQLRDLTEILREKLMRDVEPESHKKALIRYILQNCYAEVGGLFLALHNAHKNNLPPNTQLDLDSDLAQATINFVTTDDANIEIHEQTPISVVSTATAEYRSCAKEDAPTHSQVRKIGADGMQDGIEDGIENGIQNGIIEKELKSDSVTSAPINLNALETQIVHLLEFSVNGNVVPKPKFYQTRIYNDIAFKLVTAAWNKQLDDVADYAELFISNGGHSEKAIAALLKEYPHLLNESTQQNPYRFMRFISHEQAVNYNGDQIFNFFGRNCNRQTKSHIILELHSYARDVNKFKSAIQLLRRMGLSKKIADDLRSYTALAGFNNPQALSVDTLTSDKTVNQLFPVMKPHELFLVYQLRPDMKFNRATVIVQDPPQLVQFDVDGEWTVVISGQKMQNVFEAMNYSFFLSRDLSADDGLVSIVPHIISQHMELIKSTIARNRHNFKLVDDNLYHLPKLPDDVSKYRNIFVITQNPPQLIHFDNDGVKHDILNERGLQTLLMQLNFKCYLTDLVWVNTVSSVLTNIPYEALQILDSHILKANGQEILKDMGYFYFPESPDIEEPQFVSLGKLLTEKTDTEEEKRIRQDQVSMQETRTFKAS